MSGLILWAVRIIVLLMLIRIVMRLLARASGARASAARAPRKTPERIGGALVRDPQCGTYLTRERAVTLASRGETQYFCSTECRDAFLQIKASA